MTLTVSGVPLITYLLASLRIISWLYLVPPFSLKAVPTATRIVMSLALAFAVSPQLSTEVPTGMVTLAISAATEVFIGVSMGFVTYLLFEAVTAAGSLIDVFGGFSLAAAFDPLTLNQNTVFGRFHQMLMVMLLFATGGHLIVIGGLLKSFDVLPVGTFPVLDSAPDVLTTAFSMFFLTAVQIALPMVAVMFLADMSLALLTKVAPQLNAIQVMFPAKIGLTLLLIGLSFPVLTQAVPRIVDLSEQAMSTWVTGS